MKRLKHMVMMLVVLIVAVLLPTQAKADYTSGDWTYKVYEEEVIITGYSGSDTEIVVPDKIDGQKVIQIGANVFKGNYDITSVKLPETLLQIDESVFENCINLESITLPKNLVTVKKNAFKNCQAMSEVVVDSVSMTGASAFLDAGKDSETGIKVTFTENCTKVPSLFNGCSSVTEVNFGSNVTAIDNYAFYNASIKELTLGEKLTSVGVNAFADCKKLENITVKSVALSNFTLSDYDNYAVFQNAGVKSENELRVTFEDTVTQIPAYMFDNYDSGYSAVTKVNIGKNVTKIGANAFCGCSFLKEVKIPNDSALQIIDGFAFYECFELKELTLPETLTTVGNNAFKNCKGISLITVKSVALENFGLSDYDNYAVFQNVGSNAENGVTVVFADTVTRIPNNMFANHDDGYACVKSVTLGKNITSIGAAAFRKNQELETLVIPHDSLLTEIGGSAFAGCAALKELVLPEQLVTVGNNAFAGCASLAKITVKALELNDFGVDSYNDYAVFQNVGSKVDDGVKVVFTDNVTKVPANMFANYDDGYARVKSVTLGKNITSIGVAAFRKNQELETLVIPHDSLLTEIGGSAFAGCAALKELVLPEQLVTVGNNAFAGCASLAKITVKALKLNDFGVDSYNDHAVFQNVGSKVDDGVKVVFTDNVTKVPANMFANYDSGYSNVKSVTLGKNIVIIGGYAFAGCKTLEVLTIPHDSLLENIGGYAFSGCAALKSLTLTEKLTTVGNNAFDGCAALEMINVKAIALNDFGWHHYDKHAVFQNAGADSENGIKVIFSDSVTRVPNNMFANHNNGYCRVKSVELGKNIKCIGNSAFYGCKELVDFTIPENSLLTEIGTSAFYGCSELKSMTLPEKLVVVGNNAFDGCLKLGKITVKAIALNDFGWHHHDEHAVFQNVGKGLETGVEVIFTDTVTLIPANMFANYNKGYANVRSVTICSNIEKMGNSAFYGCANLQFISIPTDGKLQYFGENAFYGCKLLSQITVPISVTEVYAGTFNDCGLTDVYYSGSEEQWTAIKINKNNAPLTNAILHYEKDCNGGLHMPKDKDGVPPTCEESGLTDSSVCADCGKIFAPELFMSKLGHNYVGKVLKEPSCFVDGSKHFVCSNDPAHTYTDVLAAPGMHTYIDDVCSVCGDPGDCKHAYEIVEGVDATCIDSGLTEGRRCYLCDEVLEAQEKIPATGEHKDADHDQKCDACGADVKCGHTNQMKLNPKVATCEEEGLTEGLQCKDCGEILKEQEAIPATGHKDADHDQTCDHCGLVLACKHQNTEKIEGREPTCIIDGLTDGLKCSDCDQILEAQSVIPAKGHDYEAEENPAATCEKDGNLVYTCKNDESHTYTEVIPAKGHNFHKGECVNCGEYDDFVNPFLDVKESDWFYDPVVWAVRNEVTGGTSPITFSPNDGCTRAQVVTFLWAANGKPEPASKNNPFVDVRSSDWFYKPVLWAVENGVTGGVSANEFGPNQTCTRAQIVTFLYAAEGKPYVSGGSTFKDVSNSDWFAKPVIWAAKNDVTGGIGDGKFGPNNTCTRGQVVTFLYKADQVEITPEEPSDPNDEAYAAYIPVIEEVKNQYYTDDNSCFLCDMDDDGIDELVMVFPYFAMGEGHYEGYTYSVYDFQNGAVVTLVDSQFVSYEGGGSEETVVAVTYYMGGKAFAISGRTTVSEPYSATITLYDVETLMETKKLALYFASGDLSELSGYEIDGKPCTYDEMENAFEQGGEDVVVAELYGNDDSDGSMTLNALLTYLQATIG